MEVDIKQGKTHQPGPFLHGRRATDSFVPCCDGSALKYDGLCCKCRLDCRERAQSRDIMPQVAFLDYP